VEVARAERLPLREAQVVGRELPLVTDGLDHLVAAGGVEQELVQVVFAH